MWGGNINLFDELKNTLLKNSKYSEQNTENPKLLRNVVIEDALNMNKELLHILLSNPKLKNHFFTDVDGVLVFDKNKFTWTIENKEFLPDSYTRFKQKIGLIDSNERFISSNNDVVLSFPYKDCVLEGGQTKEDQKRSEIFFNETLAPEDVDCLLAPKVFTNIKKYTKAGEEKVSSISENDNLMIKGNNLLILSSMLKKYSGKVKLIYIDPPYNTGSDDFRYNDSFNHSTWLTFMKTRLELCKKLLSKEGAIYIQVDYHESHYLKVLCDEIFGVENFQREIIWRIGWLSGYKTKENNWIRNHDTILYYSKSNQEVKFNKKYIDKKDFKENADSSVERYPIEDVWNSSEYDVLNSIAITSFAKETVSKQLNSDDVVKGQKSEKLIKRIVEAHTEPNDLVLDFFGGSGTTAAVCMKLNRKFIVCEQLDVQLDIMSRRLRNVIQGDGCGISNSVNWTGGGSFVYCELKDLNQTYIKQIQNAGSDPQLIELYNKISKSKFINSKVKPSNIERNVSDFESLSTESKRKLLIQLLDLNMLYVNYSDIDDEEYKVSDGDKSFNRSFYGD